MTARMLAGGPVADAVFADLVPRIDKLRELGHPPGLATILVGDDEPSARYVAMKQAKAAELGFNPGHHAHLPATATQDELVATIRGFNEASDVDAILLQYPIPGHLDYEAALYEIDPDKDADAAHPMNMGRLALDMPGPKPCTPAGIEAILAFYEIPVAGQSVVVVGRGFTIGRPLSIMLSQKRPTANAAVTLVHTGVANWADYTRTADVVVAAAGVPGMVQPEHIRPGATVIGAGVRYEGKRLLPDVDEACEQVAGAITPRVGGVGPTTIAMLFRNCVETAERQVAR